MTTSDRTTADASPWWVVLLLGVVAIGYGIALTAWPAISALVFVVLMGTFFIVHGAVRILAAAFGEGEHRLLSLVLGLLAVAAGIIVWRAPLAAAVSLAIVIGAFWIVSGIVDAWAGITGTVAGNRIWAVVSGVLSFVAGAVLVTWPAISLVTLVWVNGIWLVVLGIVTVIRSFSLR